LTITVRRKTWIRRIKRVLGRRMHLKHTVSPLVKMLRILVLATWLMKSYRPYVNAMEKVRSDFGALIMINNEELKDLIPKLEKDACESACAEKSYLVATIKYADNTEGTLIYLTTTFFKGVTADLYGYKKEHPAFPDESTSDQFFDEKQFEAYRELGFQAAWKMMDYVEQTKRLWP
jgi:hypothetical protein